MCIICAANKTGMGAQEPSSVTLFSLEPAFWTTLPLYNSTCSNAVRWEGLRRAGAVQSHYTATLLLLGGYVGASSPRIAFRATAVEFSCSVVEKKVAQEGRRKEGRKVEVYKAAME